MGRSEKSGLFFIGWGVGLLRLGRAFLLACRSFVN